MSFVPVAETPDASRQAQSRTLLLWISLLIAFILPGLHFMLMIIPGLPPDPLPLRLITAAVVLLIGTAFYFITQLQRYAEQAIFVNVTLLLCVDIVLITNAKNNLIHISAGLLAIFGAQVLFTRFRYCLGSYGFALLFQIIYTAVKSDITDFRNLTTVFIYSNAYLVSGLLAYLHIRQLDRDFAQRRQIFELKQQQDGDYYLTSLLLEPLIRNGVKSPAVSVQFFIEQKKKVHFQGKDFEIGGDFCVADRITLGGEPYIFFFNGDAMGKSSQGAGGALVTGSLLHSIISRSKKLADTQLSPVRWLSSVYREIQLIMESFDGSMYVSAVFGVVGEISGEMFYINAEHPLCVLVRDGRAEFAEPEISVHKIGAPFHLTPKIYHRNLRPGDVFIAGSDGRDDLLLSDNLARSVVHENEEFPARVEAARGELIEIADNIRRSGQLTDDLSLLRIAFHGNIR